MVTRSLVRKWVDKPGSEGEMTGTGNQTYDAAVARYRTLARMSNVQEGLSPQHEAERQRLDRQIVDLERQESTGAVSSTACCGN
jgi:hypothetical protein